MLGVAALLSALFVSRKDRTGIIPAWANVARGEWPIETAGADTLAALTGYDFRSQDWKPPIGIVMMIAISIAGSFLSKMGVNRWLGSRLKGIPVRL